MRLGTRSVVSQELKAAKEANDHAVDVKLSRPPQSGMLNCEGEEVDTRATKTILAVVPLVSVMLGVSLTNNTGQFPEPDPLADNIESALHESVFALLDSYCIDCHGEDRSKAGVRFDEITDITSILNQIDDLELAHEMLVTHQMPPEKKTQPTDHERLIMIQWLEKALAYTSPTGEVDPGWFTIHRLNRDEYRNTLRDLLGIDPAVYDIAEDLPQDDVGYGFDNIADVLTVSPLHMEAYLDAAERAVDIALGPAVTIGSEPTLIPRIRREGNGRPLRQGGQFFTTNGALRANVNIPISGEYELSLYTWGTQGGENLPHLSVRVQGKEVGSFDIEATSEAEAEHHKVTLSLSAGEHDIAAHFTNDYWVPNVADRNLAIDGFSIAERNVNRPAMYHNLFGSANNGENEAVDFATEFISRAYRRPVSQDEISALLGVYTNATSLGESHEYGVRQMMAAVLVSPNFLYRSIDHNNSDSPGDVYQLSDHELASRLSYFLWSSMPDEELRNLADRGVLLDDQVLKSQITRLLDDPRADMFVENFAGQWLLLRNLPSIEIDREVYPSYSTEIRQDMHTETVMFFADVLRSDRNIFDLIDSDDVYINESLANHYGIAGVDGDEFRKVTLESDSVRGGVLTMGSTLTVTSNPTRTSPVKRGLYVLEQLLGSAPPPPPADIPRLEQSAQAVGSDASLREQLAAHLTDDSCASCHVRMDPIGLAMENFDAVGQWRDAYPEAEIDSYGVLPGGIEFDGPVQLKSILLDRKDAFREHLAGELLTYAIGRGVEPFDRPAIRTITDSTQANGDTLGAMIKSIVLSDTFRMSRGRTSK
jgi:hypothetical protein